MIFNEILKEEKKVLNHESAQAFKLLPEMELYTAVCTMALQDKFYETPQEQVNRIVELVGRVDANFVAKLAVYARREMYLRSIPLLLVVELARVHNGDNLVSRTIEQVIMRADDIVELLMCYQWRNPRAGIKKLGKLSNQVRMGLQSAFNKFDEYQFAKYNRSGLEVKLRDALFIVHPKAKDETQQEIFNRIASGTLATPYTWETELSALGTQAFEDENARRAAFKEKWSELITSGKLGYMALLRNLRNILDADVDAEIVKDVAERICSPYEVMRARQFPFRYFSAYRELKSLSSVNTSMLLDSIDDAVMQSAANISGFTKDTRVFIACDMSGSMRNPISKNSKMQYYEVGNMLAMLLQSRCEKVISGIFADEWKVVNYPHKSILGNVDALSSRIGEVGYGTYGGKPLEWLINEQVVADKVMFFTDCQFWGKSNFGKYFLGLWNEYKKIAPRAKLYLFDLAGYGHTPIEMPNNDVVLVAGWNEKVFDIIQAIEEGDNVVRVINGIEL